MGFVINYTEIPANKSLRYSLMKLKGVGLTMGGEIGCKLGLSLGSRLDDRVALKLGVKEEDLERLLFLLQKSKKKLFQKKLEKRIQKDLKKLVDLKTYRGIRHMKMLPVRGQRTHSNGLSQKREGGKRLRDVFRKEKFN